MRRWRDLVEEEIRIRQFYLAAGAGRTVRIRISDGATAMLTLKFSGEERGRDEFEYPVPLAEAEEMQAFAIGRVIEKTRYHVRHGGYLYEVDVFGGELAGLVIAELETPDDVPAEKLPPWLGREVTQRRTILQRIACPPRGSGVRRMSYRIDPRLPLTAEVQRIAAEEIDEALRHLAAARDNPDKALHECRKRLKSVRALLRLVRSGDEAFAKAENARYREVSAQTGRPARGRGPHRDRRSAGKGVSGRDGRTARSIRSATGSSPAAAMSWTEDLAAAVDAAVASCEAGHAQIGKLALPDQPERAADILADGAGKTMRRARKALQKAKDARRSRTISTICARR